SLQRGSTPPRLGPGQLPGRPHRSDRMLRMPRVGSGLSAIVLALLLFVTPTATVFAANNAEPGDPLWSAKLRLETVQLAFTMNPLREVALHLEFANRRLNELTELIAEGNENRELVHAVSENLKGHVKGAVARLTQVQGSAVPDRATELVVQDQMQQVQILNGVVSAKCAGLQEVPVAQDACGQLRHALEAAVVMLPSGTPPAVIPNPGGILLAIPPPPRASTQAGSSQTTTPTNSQVNEPARNAPAGTDAGARAASNEAPAGGGDTAKSSDRAPATDPAPAGPAVAASPTPEKPTPTPPPSPTETKTTASSPQSAPPAPHGPDVQSPNSASSPPPPPPPSKRPT
ncbi:MAG: DUF5667 domain-containing protein, partial [Actinomycetota bacterium]|nr:DUF5667 domain-containing protein [Actinomycetota bacterium]